MVGKNKIETAAWSSDMGHKYFLVGIHMFRGERKGAAG